MIHGPSVGYDNGKKNRSRREKYAFVERALGPASERHVPRRDRKVLLLDEAEGDETFFLLSKGYRASNLHVVNENSAKVAILQGRVRATTGASIQTYGVELDQALPRLLPLKFDVIHLDFTGICSDKNIATINRTAALLASGGVIVVNVQKGRETSRTLTIRSFVANPDESIAAWWFNGHTAVNQLMTVNDIDRINRMWAAVASTVVMAEKAGGIVDQGCRWHATLFAQGTYKSGKVPMMWIAAQVCEHSNRDALASKHMLYRFGDQTAVDFHTKVLTAIMGWVNIPTCYRAYWMGIFTGGGRSSLLSPRTVQAITPSQETLKALGQEVAR